MPVPNTRSYFRRRDFSNNWSLAFYQVFNGWKVLSSFTPPENIPPNVSVYAENKTKQH